MRGIKELAMNRNTYSKVIDFMLFLIIFLFPLFDSNEYHLDVAVIIGIYCIINIGLNLLLGNTGQISIGQAAFFGIGAYCSAVLTTNLHLTFWLSICFAAILTATLGISVGLTSLKLRGHYLAMATLGFGIIASTVYVEWTELTGGTSGFLNIPAPSIFGFQLDNEFKYYYLVWAFVLLVFISTQHLINSRIGRALQAIHEREITCGAMGINPAKYKLKIFTLSAAYAGIAGALFAGFQNYISPESFSVYSSIIFLCMIVIGGLGSVWGSIIGTVILSIFPEFIRAVASSEFISPQIKAILNEHSYHLIAYGFFVLIIIVFLPEGIVGGVKRLEAKAYEWLHSKQIVIE